MSNKTCPRCKGQSLVHFQDDSISCILCSYEVEPAYYLGAKEEPYNTIRGCGTTWNADKSKLK